LRPQFISTSLKEEKRKQVRDFDGQAGVRKLKGKNSQPNYEKMKVFQKLRNLFEQYVFGQNPVSQNGKRIKVFEDFFKELSSTIAKGNHSFSTEFLHILEYFEKSFDGQKNWVKQDYPFVVWMSAEFSRLVLFFFLLLFFVDSLYNRTIN